MTWPEWRLIPDGDLGKQQVADLAARKKSDASQPLALVCEESDLFRCFSQLLDEENDVVLELGSAQGVATRAFINKIQMKDPPPKEKRVLGIDISSSSVEECESDPFLSQYASFIKLDVLLEWKKLARITDELVGSCGVLNPTIVVALDLGGNRELETLVATIPFVVKAFKPRLLIVKSQSLFKAAQIYGLNLTGWSELTKVSVKAIVKRRPGSRSLQSGQKLEAKSLKGRKKWNPRAAPKRRNPETGILICRFHNYDEKRGCLRYNDEKGYGSVCEYDHEYCHLCTRKGHRAFECDAEDREESLIDLLVYSSS